MAKDKWYQKPEMIVALSALLVSLVTSFVEIYSAHSDRVYARASVWPRLEIFRSYSGVSFEYGVTNNGTGPAIIKYAKVQYKEKAIHRWRDLPELKIYTQSHIGNHILPSQFTIKPLEIGDETTARKFREIDRSVTIEICYCSIYGECWVSDRSNQPRQTKACVIDEDERFLQ